MGAAAEAPGRTGSKLPGERAAEGDGKLTAVGSSLLERAKGGDEVAFHYLVSPSRQELYLTGSRSSARSWRPTSARSRPREQHGVDVIARRERDRARSEPRAAPYPVERSTSSVCVLVDPQHQAARPTELVVLDIIGEMT